MEFPSTTFDTLLNSLPHLDILTSNSNIPGLSDIDMDQQIPFNTNFKYYSPHDFHSDADINIYLLQIISLSFIVILIEACLQITTNF